MFKVTNKINVDLSVRNEKILAELNKLKISAGKTKTREGSNVAEYDWTELAEKLEKASMISYIAPVEQAVEPFTNEELNELQKPKMSTAESFYKYFARRRLGFYQLLPQDSVLMEHNEEIIKDLISKSLAVNITIEDITTGDIVFDGGTKKVKVREIGFDDLGRKAELQIEVEEVCNLLHPDKELALYYPTKEKTKKASKDLI